jgi:hypothetical protein
MNTQVDEGSNTAWPKWVWPIIMVGMAILFWRRGYAFGQWLFDRIH